MYPLVKIQEYIKVARTKQEYDDQNSLHYEIFIGSFNSEGVMGINELNN